MLQDGLALKPIELQRVHTGGEGEDVKVWHQKHPGKSCWALLWFYMAKLQCGSEALTRGGYVIFWLGGWIAKFKIRQIKKYSVLAEITKFNARQIFPLYGILVFVFSMVPLTTVSSMWYTYVHILGELYTQAVVEQSEPATDYCIQCCNRPLTPRVKMTIIITSVCRLDSLVPRPSRRGEKKAWCTLFAHACN